MEVSRGGHTTPISTHTFMRIMKSHGLLVVGLLVVGFCLLTLKVQPIHASRTSINQETGEPMSQEDLLFSIANESGPIIITAANWGYRTVLANWICRLVDLGMHKKYTVVVLTFDEPTGELVRRQYDSVVFQIDSPRLFDPKVPNGDNGLPHHISDTLRPSQYGAPDWNSVTAQKLSGVLSLVKTNRDVVFIDLDIALVRDPLPHILQSFDYENGPDFVFQTNVRDAPSCAKQEDSTLRAQVLPDFAEFKHINSGLYYLKSNAVTVGWLEHAIATCQKDKVDDQVGFVRATQFYEHANRLKLFRNCSELRGTPNRRGKPVTAKADVALEMVACVFHECEFPTGWATGRYPARNIDPAVELNLRWMQDRTTSSYLYHPNFIQGMKNKVNKIKLKGLWVDDPTVCLPSPDIQDGIAV
eukprot:m.179309 g.179309  ORF g.179309 m.179309 type:complete len:415 (-) comp31970_c0_seq1:88-1332(-)